MQLATFNPKNVTSAQFKEALIRLGPRVTETHHRLLRAHYHFPKRTASATQLSEAVGWQKGSAANIHYGHLAGLLCEVLGKVEGSVNMYILATFISPERAPQKEWLWVMRPKLATALSELKWV